MARDTNRDNRERQLRKTGEGVSWDDLRVPLTATTRTGSKPPIPVKYKDNGAGSQGVFLDEYSGTQEKEQYFSVQYPHARLVGSDIVWHIHWTIDASTAGDIGDTVIWGLEITSASIMGTFGNTTLYTGTRVLDGTEQDKHLLTEITTLGSSPLGISAMSICRVYRDATSDTYTGAILGLEVDAHYVIDSLGSDLEDGKTY